MNFNQTQQLYNNTPQTYSGTDIMVIFSIPITQTVFTLNKPFKLSTEVQTISISSTTSILPVRRCGEARPASFCRGGRTFAGSMVFVVSNRDPFAEIFSVDAKSNSMINDGTWHIDQMPPFDIVISAQNESGGIGAQLIEGVRIANWGTTLSVDDMYTEFTYTYLAENVTPFLAVSDTFNINYLKIQSPKTPDELTKKQMASRSDSTVDHYNDSRGTNIRFQSGLAYSVANPMSMFDDPTTPRSLYSDIERSKFNDDLLDNIGQRIIQ